MYLLKPTHRWGRAGSWTSAACTNDPVHDLYAATLPHSTGGGNYAAKFVLAHKALQLELQ